MRVHPKKLTWQWKPNHFNMYLLLKVVIFHCHVSSSGGFNCAAKASVQTEKIHRYTFGYLSQRYPKTSPTLGNETHVLKVLRVHPYLYLQGGPWGQLKIGWHVAPISRGRITPVAHLVLAIYRGSNSTYNWQEPPSSIHFPCWIHLEGGEFALQIVVKHWM